MPDSGATNVAAFSNVMVTFSEPINPHTITVSTVKLVKKGTTEVVPATVSYDTSTKKATLSPSSNLQAGVKYTATVTTGAKDLAGNPLSAIKTWSFTVSR